MAAAVWLFIFPEQQAPERSKAAATAERFRAFTGAPPLLNIAFDYPLGWKLFVSQARGVEEATVQLMGPRDLIHQFSASFAVIGKKKMEGVTMESELEKLIERNKALTQFKVVSKKGMLVGGQDAQSVIFDFAINLPMGFKNAPTVMMREEVVLVLRADAFYQVFFVGTLEQHRQSELLFRRLLESFRFTK